MFESLSYRVALAPWWEAWLKAEVLADQGFHQEALVWCARAERTLQRDGAQVRPSVRAGLLDNVRACRRRCLIEIG